MTPSYQRIGNQHFLYDPTMLDTVSADLFDPESWHRAGKVRGEARGRGKALFVAGDQRDFVLRHYRRGGLISKLFTDHYFWQGLQRTRAWAEWHLLQSMFEQKLPVPKPIAARVIRHGCAYTADLLTLALPNCESLADLLKKNTWTNEILFQVGQTIHRFHQFNIYHADLNAHNILVDQAGRIYILDFDRGCKKQEGLWKKANLRRLHRSLCKLERTHKSTHFSEERWQTLLQGYEDGQSGMDI